MKSIGIGLENPRARIDAIPPHAFFVVSAIFHYLGPAFAVLLSWVVSVYLMEIDWEFDWRVTLAGIFITAAIVAVVGCLASFDVLFRKPLGTLRSQ